MEAPDLSTSSVMMSLVTLAFADLCGALPHGHQYVPQGDGQVLFLVFLGGLLSAMW